MKALFEVVAGRWRSHALQGVLRRAAHGRLRWAELPEGPDTDRNRSWIGRIRYRMGFAGYLTLRLMALAETGTRGLLGAVLGSAGDRDEACLARRLLHPLRPGMLLLLDRAFDADTFLAEADATGAMLLARARSARNPRVVAHLPDGSYLSDLDGLVVWIIEAGVTITGSDGSRSGDRYRLITTLLDHRRYPALALVRLYHERWEIETVYYALRHTLPHGHVLRSGDQPGLEQETWALLTLCQLLRMAMVDAIEAQPGTDPDRASFTTALETARDQLTAAAGICPDDPAGQPGVIGRAVLAALLPARRPRYSARIVKCSTSRYHENDDSRTRHSVRAPRPDQPPTRRQHITEIMTTCLQSDVSARPDGAALARRLSVSSREIPQLTPCNGTLMARRSWSRRNSSSLAQRLRVAPRAGRSAGSSEPPHSVSP